MAEVWHIGLQVDHQPHLLPTRLLKANVRVQCGQDTHWQSMHVSLLTQTGCVLRLKHAAVNIPAETYRLCPKE
jgi:hypothetical protein